MASPRTYPSRHAVEVLVNAALATLRQGGVPMLSPRHVRLRAAALGTWLAPVVGVLGNRTGDRDHPQPVTLLLVWALCRLRPDGRSDLEGIDERAWLQSTSWRPFLAVAAYSGILTVPPFPARYRRREGEAAIENLCGLWSVGQSTVYRYLEKARRQVIDTLSTGPDPGVHVQALRAHALRALRNGTPPPEGWPGWHRAQAAVALVDRRLVDGAWHFQQAGDVDAVLEAIQQHGTQAAGSRETDLLLSSVEADCALDVAQQVELQQCWALLWRYRHEAGCEEDALRKALRLATEAREPLPMGMALASLARFYELRDRDRSFASYEQALQHLSQAMIQGGTDRARATHAYAASLVRTAWLQLRRNNPHAKALLDQVTQIESEVSLPRAIAAPLEQTRGEYWRCVGDSSRALEHQHRALALFEQLGDQRAVLNCYRNLSLAYGESANFDRAIEYGERVVRAAREVVVEPEVLAGAHGNLGIAHFYRGDLDRAIQEYKRALEIEVSAGLKAHLSASHYNLAEAHYQRFKASRDVSDEIAGDHHAAEAARISKDANLPGLNESARALKSEVLGQGLHPDRLLTSEHAHHMVEMGEIDRLRASLSLPHMADEEVEIRLAIARVYLSIAVSEREQALAVAKRRGVQASRFEPALESIKQVFSRQLTREQQLNDAWHEAGSDLLREANRNAVLAHLVSQGSINKSAYAEAAGVSPATASKHLGLLAERGLLVQTGKGPTTRYLLPAPQ